MKVPTADRRSARTIEAIRSEWTLDDFEPFLTEMRVGACE
jgi:hypothetical protein